MSEQEEVTLKARQNPVLCDLIFAVAGDEEPLQVVMDLQMIATRIMKEVSDDVRVDLQQLVDVTLLQHGIE